MLKPIPTKYNRHFFRSRLEARWAVYFDVMGISWQYEPEGYDLGGAGWYLPDFFLPDFEAFIEVKPTAPDEVAKAKLKALIAACATSAPETVGFFAIGLPSEKSVAPPGYALDRGFNNEKPEVYDVEGGYWCICSYAQRKWGRGSIYYGGCSESLLERQDYEAFTAAASARFDT